MEEEEDDLSQALQQEQEDAINTAIAQEQSYLQEIEREESTVVVVDEADTEADSELDVSSTLRFCILEANLALSVYTITEN